MASYSVNILLHIVTHGATYLLLNSGAGRQHKNRSLRERHDGGHHSFVFLLESGCGMLCGIK